MMATADTTDKNMVRKSVRHKYFSPPWGGFFNFGMIVVFDHSLNLNTSKTEKKRLKTVKNKTNKMNV